MMLVVLMLPLLLAGCRSSKKAAREADTTTGATATTGEQRTDPSSDQSSRRSDQTIVIPSTGQTDSSDTGTKADKRSKTSKSKSKKNQLVSRLNENRQTARGIRGRVDISLKVGSNPLSASGAIKMKRDEIIQVSITALGLMEIGRMELTPEYLFILDRYHKRYLKESWNNIASLRSANVNFYTFQAIFWNELFVPGSTAMPTDEDFEVSNSGKRMRLQPKQMPQTIDVKFYTNEDKDLIYQTSLVARNGKLRFDGNCSSWNQLEGKQFPASLRLAISASKSYSADLAFTRLQVDEGMGNLSTSISDGKYTPVSLDEILKGLRF